MRKRSGKGGGAQRSIQVHLMVNEEEAAMIRAAARKRSQTVSLTIIEAVKLLEGRLQVEFAHCTSRHKTKSDNSAQQSVGCLLRKMEHPRAFTVVRGCSRIASAGQSAPTSCLRTNSLRLMW